LDLVNPEDGEPVVSVPESPNPWDAVILLGLLFAFLIEFAAVIL
jgi:hypothetical protein